MRPIRNQELRTAERETKMIFKCKVELRDAYLCQLDKNIRSRINNLTPEYIKNYVMKVNKINVLVAQNGHSDKNILDRLNIKDFQILNITCYDKNFDPNFTLQLEKFRNKQIIFEIEFGSQNKLGRLINLEETHKLVCLRKD